MNTQRKEMTPDQQLQLKIFEEVRILLEPYIINLKSEKEAYFLVFALLRHAFNGEMTLNGSNLEQAEKILKALIDEAVKSVERVRSLGFEPYSEEGQQIVEYYRKGKSN